MSLKAKIEAVIYASEEPVTLAQLVGLLGEEAQAELDRAAEAQQTLALNEAEAAVVDAELALADPVLAAELGAAVDGEIVSEPTSQNRESPEAEHAIEETGLEASGVADPTHGGETAMNGAPDSGAADATAAGRAEKARAAKLRAYFRAALDGLVKDYASEDRGLEVREVAGGFRFATKPEYHDAVRGFVKSLKPPLKLTLQALETLAVVAYKQPVTSPEISEIRGVDSSGVLGSLIVRKLITTAGRKQVIGRPILYKTTKEFLLKFGLKDVAELPSIEEFEKMAGQMAEQEEIAMEEEVRETPQAGEERLESDGEAAAAEPVADEVVVDGRISALPPQYDDGGDDPSAADAEIQAGGDGGSKASDVAGTPEGDGDFETDNLPETGETSAGGQVSPSRDGAVQSNPDRTERAGLLEKVIDEISHGKLLP